MNLCTFISKSSWAWNLEIHATKLGQRMLENRGKQVRQVKNCTCKFNPRPVSIHCDKGTLIAISLWNRNLNTRSEPCSLCRQNRSTYILTCLQERQSAGASWWGNAHQIAGIPNCADRYDTRTLPCVCATERIAYATGASRCHTMRKVGFGLWKLMAVMAAQLKRVIAFIAMFTRVRSPLIRLDKVF